MEEISVKVSNRGYIVLPAKIRKEMNLKAGTHILLSRKKDRIILEPVRSFTEKLSGITEGSFGKTPKKVQEYINGERKER